MRQAQQARQQGRCAQLDARRAVAQSLLNAATAGLPTLGVAPHRLAAARGVHRAGAAAQGQCERVGRRERRAVGVLRSAQAAADLVVKRALEKGSSDNATAVVIHYATPSAAPARSAVATNHLRRPAMVLIAAFVVLLLGAGAWAWQASARSESTPTVAPTQPLVASETVTVVATERSAPAGPPTSTAAPTNTPTPTATATATATYTPTPTPTKTPLPTSSVRFTPLPGTQSEMTPTQEQAIPTVVLATPEPTQEMTSEPVPETTSEPIPEATPVTVPEPTPEPALPTPQTLVEPAEAPPPTATPEAPSQEAPLDQPEQ